MQRRLASYQTGQDRVYYFRMFAKQISRHYSGAAAYGFQLKLSTGPRPARVSRPMIDNFDHVVH